MRDLRATMELAHVAGVVGDGDFKNRFREIDGYGRMVHGWTPPFVIGLEPECGLAQYDADHAAGGVHSIACSRRPPPCSDAGVVMT
jgi:hypothetical protein